MSYLLEKDGERVWTLSRARYDDSWTVLKEGAGAKPKEFADFIDGEWIINTARKTAAERRAKFMAMDREQMVDFLLAIIAKGDARLDKLEARLAALDGSAILAAPTTEEEPPLA